MDIIKAISIDFLIYIFLFLCYMEFLSDQECGIPMKNWLEIHLCLILLNSVQKFILIWIVRTFVRYRLIYNLLATTVIYLVMVGWLVYGNVIFFSEANDCK